MKPPHTGHRPLVDREDRRVAPVQRDHLRPGLHSWALFRQYQLPATKVLSRLGQQDGNLQGKHVFPIQILVQAVVVARAVLQQ